MINNLKSTYFKQVRRGKLGFWTEIYLHRRGKIDYQKHIVRQDENNYYMSPFVKKEISLYAVAIKKEMENCSENIARNQVNMKRAQLEVKRKKQQIDRVIDLFEDDNMLDVLNQNITTITLQEQELELFEEKEKQIVQLHCEQLYYILEARISAYWEGVLSAKNSTEDFPPELVIKDYVQNMKIFEMLGDENT